MRNKWTLSVIATLLLSVAITLWLVRGAEGAQVGLIVLTLTGVGGACLTLTVLRPQQLGLSPPSVMLLLGIGGMLLGLWWDVALVAGSPFKQKIEQKLRQSSATIVILAASSLEEGKPQEWVYQESALSAELGRELVPVRTDDTPLPLGWRALVLHRQIIDARGSALSDAVASIVARGHALGCC